jgi:hypothetical protein
LSPRIDCALTLAIGNAFTALWWGVAQGAQTQNVKITMASSVNGKGHTGIRLGRGSTLGLADVRVERGQVSLLKISVVKRNCVDAKKSGLERHLA